MKKKSILLACASIATVFGLASCGGTSSSSNSNTSNETSVSSENGSSTETSINSSENISSTTVSSENDSSESLTSSGSSSSTSSGGTTSSATPSTSSSSSSASSTTTTSGEGTPVVQGEVVITKSAGYFESGYVEWSPVEGAENYNVYYKDASAADTTYKKIDAFLIRQYSDHFRADVVGLKAGSYEIKVAAVDASGKESDSFSSVQVTASAYDRSGYAFSNGKAFGAYNEDGTIRSDAQVIYVTGNNAKTVTATIGGNQVTGLQAIIQAKQKKNNTDVLNIRIVGEIKDTDMDGFESSAIGLQIKGAAEEQNMNMTVEGIGEDATINGFGILIRNCSNVELRNFGIVNFLSDGVSVDTNNSNLWIHNIDFFYGKPGKDSDQVKGDGSLDIKKSHHITVSYNHFWDSGKACLVDASAGSGSNYLTYHHNWFDHSDSRHPRIRNATAVHIYNNYFDGNSKYGVGVTTGSSAYVEGNYFRNCKYPMLISKQGTDALGDGTFSGNPGGMIKAYDNSITGATSLIYANSSAGTRPANATQFDAYLASTRSETVADSYKAVLGGTSYSNFDTATDFYSYSYESPDNARATVQGYAGRINGGDLKWTFNNATEDTNYEIIAGLKAAVTNYNSSVVKIMGDTSTGGDTPIQGLTAADVIALIDALPDASAVTAANKQAINEAEAAYESLSASDKALVTNYQKLADCIAALAALPQDSQVLTFNSGASGDNPFFTVDGNMKDSVPAKTYDGETYTKALKIESSTSIKFTTTKDTQMILITDGDASKTIKVQGVAYNLDANGIVTVDITAGEVEVTKGSTLNLYAIIVL